jgi:hypothetical protein
LLRSQATETQHVRDECWLHPGVADSIEQHKVKVDEPGRAEGS